MFNRLVLDGDQPKSDVSAEDAIVNAMQSSGLDVESSGAEKSKLGQIVVELERVVLGKKRIDDDFRAKHREGRSDEVDIGGQDIIHATG